MQSPFLMPFAHRRAVQRVGGHPGVLIIQVRFSLIPHPFAVDQLIMIVSLFFPLDPERTAVT